MKIAVFMGGISSEREVSLNSGKAILESLLKQGYDAYGIDVTKENLVSAFIENEYDFAYLAFHGGFGEDGSALNRPECLIVNPAKTLCNLFKDSEAVTHFLKTSKYVFI